MINISRIEMAIQDVHDSIKGQGGWIYFAWQEVKQRYRRSILGPFWITISTGVMILAMGPVYGYLLQQPILNYILYLAVSMVIWSFISNTVNEACFSLISSEAYIKQIKLPYSSYVLKTIFKNMIMLFHNLIIVLVVYCFTQPINWLIVPLSVIGFLVIALNLTWLSIILAIVCARYRDVAQMVASIVQLSFFVTPVIWERGMLLDKAKFVDWNPLYHLIEIARAPLLGKFPSSTSWIIAVAMLLLGSIFSFLIFAKNRGKISYLV